MLTVLGVIFEVDGGDNRVVLGVTPHTTIHNFKEGHSMYVPVIVAVEDERGVCWNNTHVLRKIVKAEGRTRWVDTGCGFSFAVDLY